MPKYFVKAAAEATLAAARSRSQLRLSRPRIQSSIDQRYKAINITSHIRLVAETRNTGHNNVITAARNGSRQNRRAIANAAIMAITGQTKNAKCSESSLLPRTDSTRAIQQEHSGGFGISCQNGLGDTLQLTEKP